MDPGQSRDWNYEIVAQIKVARYVLRPSVWTDRSFASSRAIKQLVCLLAVFDFQNSDALLPVADLCSGWSYQCQEIGIAQSRFLQDNELESNIF